MGVQDLLCHQNLELSRASSVADAHVLRRKVRVEPHSGDELHIRGSDPGAIISMGLPRFLGTCVFGGSLSHARGAGLLVSREDCFFLSR